MANKIEVIYNVATNTYTYTNISAVSYSLIPLNSTRRLGLTQTTTILPFTSYTSTYINMVCYQQVIIRCPTLIFENNSTDNIQTGTKFYRQVIYYIGLTSKM